MEIPECATDSRICTFYFHFTSIKSQTRMELRTCINDPFIV